LEVAIIPKTWEVTNLSRLKPGDGVNLEADVIGKYVDRLLAFR
jgi:riboflavin synthase